MMTKKSLRWDGGKRRRKGGVAPTVGPEVVGAVVLAPGQVQGPGKIFWIMERKRSSGFRRILTVAFVLFIDPVGGSNPTGQPLIFTKSNQKYPIKSYFLKTRKPATSLSFLDLFILTSLSRSKKAFHNTVPHIVCQNDVSHNFLKTKNKRKINLS